MRKSSHPKILEGATRNQPENPVLQHSVNSPAGGDSVFSSAWSTDVSQVNPEGAKFQIPVKTHFYHPEPKFIESIMSNILFLGA